MVLIFQVIIVNLFIIKLTKFYYKAPKNEIFQKDFIFLKRPPDFASNEPQPPPDIKFKSSYARKRDFGLLCPNMKIRPQAPKNGIFQKISIFLKRSSDFDSNESSTTCRQSLSQVMQKNILSKKLSLGLNFSTPSEGVTSPLLDYDCKYKWYKHSFVGTLKRMYTWLGIIKLMFWKNARIQVTFIILFLLLLFSQFLLLLFSQFLLLFSQFSTC